MLDVLRHHVDIYEMCLASAGVDDALWSRIARPMGAVLRLLCNVDPGVCTRFPRAVRSYGCRGCGPTRGAALRQVHTSV